MASVDPRTLQLLIDASVDGVLILDEGGCIEYANPAAASLLGQTLANLVGREFGVPVVTGEKTEIELPSGKPPRVAELRCGEADTPRGARRIVQLRDTTDAARRLSEVLAEATYRSNALNIVAHELRSPLSVIVGYASMLEEGAAGELSPTAQHMVGQIAAKAAVLRDSVEQLLAAARLERSAITSTPERIAASELLTRAYERNQARAALAAATLEVDPDTASDGVVEADPDQVATILDNLIGNAIAHCPPPVTIRLSCESRDGSLRLLVSDDGPGVPEADRERIFRAFERSGDPGGREGTGLGLAIARELATLNEGELTLLHASGRGATFAVALPLAPAEARSD